MIFKARSEDGQLADTDLTFRDLNRIKETFMSMLMAIYHVRMKYPGQGEEAPPPAETDKPPKAYPASLQQEGVIGIPEQSIRVVPAEEEDDDDDELHEEEQQNGHLPTMGDPSRRAQAENEETPGDGAAKPPPQGEDGLSKQDAPSGKEGPK